MLDVAQRTEHNLSGWLTAARDEAGIVKGSRPSYGTIADYGLAILIFAIAVVARVALDRIIPERLPFIAFFPAVVFVAYRCGLWPSIVVLILSALVGTAWVEPAPGSSEIGFRVASLLLFLGFGGLNVYFMQRLKVANVQSVEHEAQLELINRELKHRIKNLFTIASSICQQTIKSGKSPQEMTQAVSGRIHAVAAAQDLLSVRSNEGADLAGLIEALVRTVAPDPSRFRTSGTSVRLPAQATTPFALILHELGTNALKYGAWSAETGTVVVAWTMENGRLFFDWREIDGPAIAPEMREGLGSALIKSGLPTATVAHDLTPTGLHCRITLPL